ncbi:MAG: type IV pilus assembly protein PilM [Acidobacteriota bacterium]
MLFSRNRSLVGLDIGSSSIKLVQLRESGRDGGYRLENLGVAPLSPEAIVDGAIMDSGLVVDVIQNLFRENKVKGADVALSLSGHSVIIKRVSLPTMNEEELAESIQWEAEQYIPFDIQDVNIDYQILQGDSMTAEGNMDVLLVAVKKSKINDYTSAIHQAGKTPMVVDVDVFALQNAFETNYAPEYDLSMALVNIGASVTNISIMQGANSVFWRDISIGGNQYTDAIQKELNVSYGRAESLKKGEEAPGENAEQLQQIFKQVNQDVCSEIQKTLDFFKATTAGEPVNKIVLSGGSCRVPGLQEMLAERFGVPIEMFNPFQAIQVSDKRFPQEQIHDLAPTLAVAVGLALRKAGDK